MHLPVLLFSSVFPVTAPTEIYTLSLHDALPISWSAPGRLSTPCTTCRRRSPARSNSGTSRRRSGRPPEAEITSPRSPGVRSEEHTSELQSLRHLVCRLLLEKKKKTKQQNTT